jgi:hypothetical protein
MKRKLFYLKDLSPRVNRFLPRNFKPYMTKHQLKPNVHQLIFYDVSYDLYKLLTLTYRVIPKEINCTVYYNKMLKNERFKQKRFTKILLKEKKTILKNFFFLSTKRKFFHEFFRPHKNLYKYLVSIGILTYEEYYYLKVLDDIFLIWVKLFLLADIKKKIRKIKKR